MQCWPVIGGGAIVVWWRREATASDTNPPRTASDLRRLHQVGAQITNYSGIGESDKVILFA